MSGCCHCSYVNAYHYLRMVCAVCQYVNMLQRVSMCALDVRTCMPYPLPCKPTHASTCIMCKWVSMHVHKIWAYVNVCEYVWCVNMCIYQCAYVPTPVLCASLTHRCLMQSVMCVYVTVCMQCRHPCMHALDWGWKLPGWTTASTAQACISHLDLRACLAPWHPWLSVCQESRSCPYACHSLYVVYR